MKSFILLLSVFLNNVASATTYFVSTNGDDKNSGTAESTAWRTLLKIQTEANNGTIKAGDSIVFRRGDVFTGTLKWATIWGQNCASGTSKKPITFTSYGTGAKPVFLYPREGAATPENRILMLFSGVNYIVIDGLKFTDLADTSNDKIKPGNCGIPVYLGTTGEATTNHCTIKNIEISLCGMGVVIIGDFNTVTNSKLTNFKNLKSTANTGGNTAYEDYGANAITISGNDNEISHNYISGAWAESIDFGWNGGACEMFNTCNRNRLIYNTIYDCGGVSEFGAQQEGASANDNLFAFNKIINCGSLTYCNIEGKFAIQVSNVQYFNNTIVENNKSRFSGPHTGDGITSPGPRSLIKPDGELFSYNGTPAAEIVFNLKNNIFQLSTGIAVSKKNNDQEKYVHENNIYRLSSGSVINFTPSASELNTSSGIFKDTSAEDPLLWNYELTPVGNAKNAGANAQIMKPLTEFILSMIAAEAVADFTIQKPASLFDLSANNILEKIKEICYMLVSLTGESGLSILFT